MTFNDKIDDIVDNIRVMNAQLANHRSSILRLASRIEKRNRHLQRTFGIRGRKSSQVIIDQFRTGGAKTAKEAFINFVRDVKVGE